MKNEDDHMGHLRGVLLTLKEHQLYAKYSKYEFWSRSLTFLGHFISCEGVEVDPRNTEPVKNYTRPLTLTEVRSFLDFVSIASPLTTFT